MSKTVLDAKQKALEINLNSQFYGSFAEIGAGQEVVRHFFRAGGAAGTVAKTMSAYDMKFSDDIYGAKSSRYVSQERLLFMLSHEYGLLGERLKDRAENTCFFAFANTVAAKSYHGRGECHGWLGVRFQHVPGAAPCDVTIHVRMFDKVNFQQQEALGIVGVNLIYAIHKHLLDSKETFIESLMDELTTDRIEIDMIKVSGEAFENLDGRLLCLELVKREFCQAILFDSLGEALQASDALYKKNVLICRGSYRPPTLLNLDMLKKGKQAFMKSLNIKTDKSILVLPEISTNKLRERGGEVDNEDFLARVKLLNSLGQNVLISNYKHFSDLGAFVSLYNRHEVAFVTGVYNLEEIFNEEAYQLEESGGMLENVGRLFSKRTQMFVYPAVDDESDQILKLDDIDIDEKEKNLLTYLKSIEKIRDLPDFDKNLFKIWSRVVLKMIENDEPGWEKMVPESVEKAVKENCLFGAKCD